MSHSVGFEPGTFEFLLTYLLIYYLPNMGGGQNLERRNVERQIFRNFKIMIIIITNDSFIFKFIFSLFINYLHKLIIFIIVKY